MNRYLLCFLALSCSHGLHAQWTGAAPGPIYYDQGNVGISWNDPHTQLVVGSNFGANISGSGGGNGIFGSNLAVYNGGPDHNQLYTPSSHGNSYGYSGMQAAWGRLNFYTGDGNTSLGAVVNPIPRLTILENGNVGINATNPQEQLHVRGRIYFEGTESTGTGWKENYFLYRGHSLVIGSPVGVGRNNVIDIKPGGSSSSVLNSSLRLYTANNATSHDVRVKIQSGGASYFNGGNILIGKTSQSNTIYKLDVAGPVRANEIVVNTTGADYVFEEDYPLKTLSEVETYIQENGHLPDIPSAEEMQTNGMAVGELNTKLLEKIEELTLYMLEFKAEIQELKKENEYLKQQILKPNE